MIIFQVLYEKDSEIVAHFKTTAIIMPSGIFKITGLPLETDLYDCNVTISDTKLTDLLHEPLKPKKKKNKTKSAEVKSSESKA